jgi:hypothetical protein
VAGCLCFVDLSALAFFFFFFGLGCAAAPAKLVVSCGCYINIAGRKPVSRKKVSVSLCVIAQKAEQCPCPWYCPGARFVRGNL